VYVHAGWVIYSSDFACFVFEKNVRTTENEKCVYLSRLKFLETSVPNNRNYLIKIHDRRHGRPTVGLRVACMMYV